MKELFWLAKINTILDKGFALIYLEDKRHKRRLEGTFQKNKIKTVHRQWTVVGISENGRHII